MTAVGINGHGRIGRLLARRLYERDDARRALEPVSYTHLTLPTILLV